MDHFDELILRFGSLSIADTTTKVSLKLLVDVRGQRVLFAEAGEDFVNFLFSIMSLPVGTVVRLLNRESMVGSLGNLYESIENLSDAYMQPFQDKDALLKPKILASGATKLPRLLPSIETSNDSKYKGFYCCGNYDCRTYISGDPKATCPQCRQRQMSYQLKLVETDQGKASYNSLSSSYSSSSSSESEGGYVKGVVPYMVMDDLKVKPMSTISSIASLNKFNVKDVDDLGEKTIKIGMDEALKLLKASMQSKTVLTDVFFNKAKDFLADYKQAQSQAQRNKAINISTLWRPPPKNVFKALKLLEASMQSKTVLTDVFFKKAKDFLADYKQAQQQVQRNKAISISTLWRPPPKNVFKVNFEGAYDAKNMIGGVGVIVRDHEGFVHGCAAIKFDKIYTARMAEAKAAVAAIEFANQMGVVKAIFEGDAIEIINKLRMKTEDLSDIGVIINEKKSELEDFQEAQFQHTSRQSNEVAHLLAIYGLLITGYMQWFLNYPDFLHQSVIYDAINS